MASEKRDLKLPSLQQAIANCIGEQKTDMFSYSGKINRAGVNGFIAWALRHKKHNNITFLLTTYGGDAHAAYRLARFLQAFYLQIRVLILGPCKSAGTLVAICAHELAFHPFGELGPLDIQVYKKDDLLGIGSGLDTSQALAILQGQAFAAFEDYMLAILERGQGAISTTTACNVACQLVTGLFAPIAAQIDPQKMGEMERQIDIAKAYGERLGSHNLKGDALSQLVRDYPSHSFIIDYKEARNLFKNVSRINENEVVIVTALEEKGACIIRPGDDTLYFDVSDLADTGGENEAGERDSSDIGPNGQGIPVEPESPADAGTPRRAKPRQKRVRSEVGTVQ